jgi:tetratricopeptide (TPR) repeat protein
LTLATAAIILREVGPEEVSFAMDTELQRRPLVGLFTAVIALLIVGAFAVPTIAQDSLGLRGDASAYAAEGDRLFHFLGAAKTEAEGRAMEDEIWRHWMLAPDATAADLMARAMDRRENYDLAGAVEVLDQLIAVAPDWAEAWNQRATIRFMQGDLQGSLDDIEETLQREPRHFGAMAGMALILTQQGRVEQAQAILKKAVGIHPFLRERSMIVALPGDNI